MKNPAQVVTSSISQSNLIFALILFAFVVFITMRGKLPQYLQALVGTNAAPAGAGASGSGTGGAVSGVDAAAGLDSPGGILAGVDSMTGSDVLGRAATQLRQGLGNALSLGGAAGGIFQ